jgi:probable F420-dependent oxidoreductase
MKYGITVPNFGSYGEPRALAALAREAEDAGWDGFFVWDHIGGGDPSFGPDVSDPWVLLTAIALNTERIRIGTMITPVPRRRPWVLARQTVTLDRLSNGRLILGVGLGFPPTEYSTFGEDPDERVRARKLDEGLDVLTGLWSGEPFSYGGEHFRIEEVTFQPPAQRPRIPIWVAGMWPAHAPFRRAAKYDGAFPIHADITPITPDELREIVAYTRAHRTSDEPFDIILSGERGGGPYAWTEPLSSYEAAGATWWLETLTDWRAPIDQIHDYVRRGPPA